MKRHLTDATIKRLAWSGETLVIYDAAMPGFGIRVGKKRKVFFAIARDTRSGRQHRVSLGNYPVVTLKNARLKASEWMRDVSSPSSPDRTVRRERLADAAQAYLHQKKGSVGAAHLANIEFNVSGLVKALGRMHLDEVRRSDIKDFIGSRKTPAQQVRAHQTLMTMFKWFLTEDLIETNPASQMARPAKLSARERWLDQDEIKIVWDACDQLADPFARFIQFYIAIAGAGRKSDVVKLSTTSIRQFAERNRAGDVAWVDCLVFENSTKAKDTHVVPLNPLARSVLPASAGLFFSKNGRTPMQDWSRSKNRLDRLMQIEAWTIHDIRRTASTHFADYLDFPRYVVEQLQNRRSTGESSVVGTYNRARYLKQKRLAMEEWSDYLIDIVA